MRWVLAGAAALGLTACDTTRSLFRDRSELVVDPQVCVSATLPIYFEENRADLTRPARQLIETTADRLRGCDIRRVRVLGLADASGTAERNRTLSERRAVGVARRLAEAGWPAPAFEVLAAGEEGAMQGDFQEPVRRRVEIVVEAVPPGA